MKWEESGLAQDSKTVLSQVSGKSTPGNESGDKKKHERKEKGKYTRGLDQNGPGTASGKGGTIWHRDNVAGSKWK